MVIGTITLMVFLLYQVDWYDYYVRSNNSSHSQIKFIRTFLYQLESAKIRLKKKIIMTGKNDENFSKAIILNWNSICVWLESKIFIVHIKLKKN